MQDRRQRNISAGVDTEARPEHQAPVGQQANECQQPHRHQPVVLNFRGKVPRLLHYAVGEPGLGGGYFLFGGSGHAVHDGSGRSDDFLRQRFIVDALIFHRGQQRPERVVFPEIQPAADLPQTSRFRLGQFPAACLVEVNHAVHTHDVSP